MAVTSYNHWRSLAAAYQRELKQMVIDVAEWGGINVQGFIIANGQIDTGFMHDSVYVVTAKGSNYGKFHADLTPYQALHGHDMFDEVDPPADAYEALFAVGATYAEYQNYGTRFIPARPFWEPALEKTQVELDDRLSKVEGNVSGSLTDISS
jgi:hypothetical protein